MSTILYVEDNEANMLVIQRIMDSKAFKLIPAFNAEDGLLLAQKHLPNLILMDIHLPGMDGLTATRLLKENPQLRHIPVIAVTASTQILEEDCLDAGCSGYILKPVTLAKILLVFQKHGVY